MYLNQLNILHTVCGVVLCGVILYVRMHGKEKQKKLLERKICVHIVTKPYKTNWYDGGGDGVENYILFYRKFPLPYNNRYRRLTSNLIVCY